MRGDDEGLSLMLLIVAPAALLLAGFLAAWLDDKIGRRVAWLVLLLVAASQVFPIDRTETGIYRLFLVGTALIAVLLVYAGLSVWFSRRRNRVGKTT